jgi:hypothetical protein
MSMGSWGWDVGRSDGVARGLADEVVEAVKLRSFAALRAAQDDNALEVMTNFLDGE